MPRFDGVPGLLVPCLLLLLVACGGPLAPGGQKELEPQPDYEVVETTVEREPVTVELASGAMVQVPGLEEGQVTISITEAGDLSVIEDLELNVLTRSVQISVSDAVSWPEDEYLVLSWPLADEGVVPSKALFVPKVTDWDDTIGVVRVAGTGGTGQLTVLFAEPRLDEVSNRLTVSIAPEVLHDLSEGNRNLVSITVADDVIKYQSRFWPTREGLFRVKTGEILAPSLPDFDEQCDNSRLPDILTTGGMGDLKSSDTAVVMVHGWQTLGEAFKGRSGDNPLNQVHCTGWLDIMSAYQYQTDWVDVKSRSDLFTFRYDWRSTVAGNN